MRDRRLAIIFAVVLVDMLSFSIVLPLLPYLAGELGATPFQIGLLAAMYPIFQFIGAPILGRLSDRYGRKPILLISIAGTMLGFVVLATAHSLSILFLSRALDGITGGNISVAQAYISDVTKPEERGKALGMIGAAFGMGFILGPITGGLLSGISYTAPAWLGAALALANLALVAVLLPESLTAEDKARLAARPKRGQTDSFHRGAPSQASRSAAHRPHADRAELRHLREWLCALGDRGPWAWCAHQLVRAGLCRRPLGLHPGFLHRQAHGALGRRRSAAHVADRRRACTHCVGVRGQAPPSHCAHAGALVRPRRE